MLLRKYYEQARGRVIEKLYVLGYYETFDRRPLCSCSLSELEHTLRDLENEISEILAL